MTDHTDLIARLRALSRYAHDDKSIGDEAADAIEQVQVDVERLRSGELWALCFVADIRAAVGDDGKRMRPELIKHLRQMSEDAARYRWLRANARCISEHWGGRWSLVLDGPAPTRDDDEGSVDAAIDAAMAKLMGGER